MNRKTIFKPYIRKKDYAGGITREEILSDSNVDRVWKLSSNENALGPSPLAQRAIIDHLDTIHEYKFRDDSELKRSIVATRPHLIPENIITANSGIETLELICRGFLSPGLECIISHPTFVAYESMIENEGSKVVNVPLNPEDYTLDVQAILQAVTERTRLVFITNPNNPTGTYTGKERIDYLIHNLPEDVLVVYDEVYFHFADAPDYPRAFDYIKARKNVIGVHSFSKAYGLAGIRLGYGISTPQIISYLENTKRPFIINTLSMVAGIHALRDTEHLKKTLDVVRSEKKYLYAEFDKLDLTYWPSQTNFIFIAAETGADDFTAKMLEEGIMVRPCSKFGAPKGVRITIGTREANTALVSAIQKIYSYA
ncbi:histidinol-phosphate transaminase [Pricia sp. S334]|uniref:histidinol-phosphate transaminase n=1 Tax=Pricia mediterranea TaxID=3076079 RepID=A0ABU3L0I2_9FLAO|nr:histidinol-phosphate transaminase [Pricia sp. S334]MDT7827115.1 histidinol-phosphate transaminase [Pricia sp. S334]